MSSQPPYTSAEFHSALHKQIIAIADQALSETKLGWDQVSPVLDVARAVCRDDVVHAGRLTLHGLEEQGDGLVEAEEAYLSLSVRDREDGGEWLSHSWWLSDVVLADPDPIRVRSAVAGMERTLARLTAWLAERESEGAAAQGPAVGKETTMPGEGPATAA